MNLPYNALLKKGYFSGWEEEYKGQSWKQVGGRVFTLLASTELSRLPLPLLYTWEAWNSPQRRVGQGVLLCVAMHYLQVAQVC